MTEQEWKTEFARRMRILIRRNEYDQKKLAEESGITESAISHYRHGTRMPSANTIYKLARALHCNTDDLINMDIPFK